MAPGHRDQDVTVEGESVKCDDRQGCRMEGLQDGGSVGAQGLWEPWLQESRYNLLVSGCAYFYPLWLHLQRGLLVLWLPKNLTK